jgi:hypothetical protein
MNFSKQTLVVFQQLLAMQKISVLDQNADQAYSQLAQARQELNVAIQELLQSEQPK